MPREDFSEENFKTKRKNYPQTYVIMDLGQYELQKSLDVWSMEAELSDQITDHSYVPPFGDVEINLLSPNDAKVSFGVTRKEQEASLHHKRFGHLNDELIDTITTAWNRRKTMQDAMKKMSTQNRYTDKYLNELFQTIPALKNDMLTLELDDENMEKLNNVLQDFMYDNMKTTGFIDELGKQGWTHRYADHQLVIAPPDGPDLEAKDAPKTLPENPHVYAINLLDNCQDLKVIPYLPDFGKGEFCWNRYNGISRDERKITAVDENLLHTDCNLFGSNNTALYNEMMNKIVARDERILGNTTKDIQDFQKLADLYAKGQIAAGNKPSKVSEKTRWSNSNPEIIKSYGKALADVTNQTKNPMLWKYHYDKDALEKTDLEKNQNYCHLPLDDRNACHQSGKDKKFDFDMMGLAANFKELDDARISACDPEWLAPAQFITKQELEANNTHKSGDKNRLTSSTDLVFDYRKTGKNRWRVDMTPHVAEYLMDRLGYDVKDVDEAHMASYEDMKGQNPTFFFKFPMDSTTDGDISEEDFFTKYLPEAVDAIETQMEKRIENLARGISSVKPSNVSANEIVDVLSSNSNIRRYSLEMMNHNCFDDSTRLSSLIFQAGLKMSFEDNLEDRNEEQKKTTTPEKKAPTAAKKAEKKDEKTRQKPAQKTEEQKPTPPTHHRTKNNDHSRF